jgi:hypothetical protein
LCGGIFVFRVVVVDFNLPYSVANDFARRWYVLIISKTNKFENAGREISLS